MVDWNSIFIPTLSVVEIFVRGTLVYLLLFLLLRLIPRRQVGQVGPSDLLVLVLIADAVQNGMSSDYKSVTEGLILVGTILFWAFAIDWLDDRFPQLHLSVASPSLIIKDGRVIDKNLKKEALTHEELLSQLRQQGVETITEVEKAYVEGDGHLSVIRRKP